MRNRCQTVIRSGESVRGRTNASRGGLSHGRRLRSFLVPPPPPVLVLLPARVPLRSRSIERGNMGDNSRPHAALIGSTIRDKNVVEIARLDSKSVTNLKRE